MREGNVRVTLDENIRTGLDSLDFLRPGVPLTRVSPYSILEVKFDNYLPEMVAQLTRLESRSASAFSKYAQARMFY